MDDWLAEKPSQHSIIEASLKSRRTSHKKYLEDIRTFDSKRYWENFKHIDPCSDSESDEYEHSDTDI